MSMRMFVEPVAVYLHREPVDFRKSINGLAVIVEAEMAMAPMSGALYVFCNRTRDKLKLLYWGVPRTLERTTGDAVAKMRVGPSESPFRGRLQTAHCCCVQKARW